jgi:HEAT repeat protein
LSDSILRSLSTVVLRAMGPAAAKSIPGLVMALDDASRSVRAVGADALGNLEPAAKPVVETLSQHLLGANEPVVFVLRSVAHGAGECRSHRRR